MDAYRIDIHLFSQTLESQERTTYAVSPKFVIKESIGTGVLDSNFIPNMLKSFWELRELEVYKKVDDLQVLLGKTEIWSRTNKTKERARP
jgi:hypothetical protein